METLQFKVVLVLILVLLGSGLFSEPSQGDFWKRLAVQSRTKEEIHGTYEIFLDRSGVWQLLGIAQAGKDFRDFVFEAYPKEDSMKTFRSSGSRVRIIQKGGGAAHIDSITLDGIGPVNARFPDHEGIDLFLLKKLQATDHDVIDALDRVLELEFPEGARGRLLINARVEGDRISPIPFAFPRSNQFRKIDPASEFYSYEVGTFRSYPKDPFFKVYCIPGSGHPPGWAYGWIANDEKNLYVRLDFTPDNTMDGLKDYAKLYIKTSNGILVFSQSIEETSYGTPSFAFTDKVAYQHKVYEFTIPLSEIPRMPESKYIRFAMEAYGTASPYLGSSFPFLAFDSAYNRYLLIPKKSVQPYDLKPYVQYYTWDLMPIGNSHAISESTEPVTTPWADIDTLPAAAFASDGSALVVWAQGPPPVKIWARRLDSSGVPLGSMIQLSDYTYPVQRPCSVAYDPGTNNFFVVWTHFTNEPGQGKIKGCFISASTGIVENTFTVVESSEANFSHPTVLFADGEYLIVWKSVPDQILSRKYSASGSPLSSIREISNGPSCRSPSIAYDRVNKKFLVVWTEDNDYIRVFARLLESDGTPQGTNGIQVSPLSDGFEEYPHVVYSQQERLFTVVWNRRVSSTSTEIYQQQVNPDGTLKGSPVHITSGAYTPYPGGSARVVNTRNGDQLMVTSMYNGSGEYELFYAFFDYPNGPAPAAVVLDSPADGAIISGTSVILKWQPLSGPGITYRVYCGTDPNFTDSSSFSTVASDSNPSIPSLAGTGIFTLVPVLLSGFGLGSRMHRRGISTSRTQRIWKRLILGILCALAFGMISSCFGLFTSQNGSENHSDGGTPTGPGTLVLKEYSVTGLTPATTYYWKIVTDNGESLTSSSVRSFRTQ
ncbi:MAG: fibronectin type III domain-containing protein [Spirochaetes bacterium]|nr:fibronectin type III domain-containing protein [Spirochaetota bacterium]